jgi:antitoxin component of MazEF toxin-antitoxin module
MIKKLTRTGNSIAAVLDKPLLEELGLDENSEVEISTQRPGHHHHAEA